MKRRTRFVPAVLLAALATLPAACGGGNTTVEAQAKPEPLAIETT